MIIKVNKFLYKIFNKINLIITIIFNNRLYVIYLRKKIIKIQIITITNYSKILFQLEIQPQSMLFII
jgi:hypothetical protein